MNCLRCARADPHPQHAFCMACGGASATVFCAECLKTDPTYRHCGHCGATLAKSRCPSCGDPEQRRREALAKQELASEIRQMGGNSLR